jgi:chemotaxis protein methyltransferase CheR
MDVIFCRNVIIYFDHAAKRRVVEAFHRSLCQGGYLLLGHSESLMNVTTLFALRHLRNDMVYQKPQMSGGGIE